MHHASQGAMIKRLGIREISNGVVVTPILKVVLHRVVILLIYPTNLRVRSAKQFRPLFKLMTEVNLVLVISLVRLVDKFREVHPLVSFAMVAILDQLDQLVLVQLRGYVMDAFF